MKRTGAVVALLVSLALAGCRGSAGSPTPTESRPKPPTAGTENPNPTPVKGEDRSFPAGTFPPGYRFEPVDLTTSVGETPLQVWVEGLGSAPADLVVKRISSKLSLRTWPEMDVVSTTVRTSGETPPAPAPGAVQVPRVFLTPTSPLSDRWYALVMDGEPSPIVPASDPANSFVTTDGRRVSRFRIGSEVIPVSMREYDKGAEYSVYLDFSERIKPTQAFKDIVKIQNPSGVDASCQPETWPPDATGYSIRFACQERVLSVPRQIAIGAGLVSNGGSAVAQGMLAVDPAKVVHHQETDYVKIERAIAASGK